MLEPGDRVIVVMWGTTNAVGVDQNKFSIYNVQLRFNPKFDETFEGRMLDLDTRATVVSFLPQLETITIGGKQGLIDWVLLLTDDGTLGWTDEIEGLKVIDDR